MSVASLPKRGLQATGDPSPSDSPAAGRISPLIARLRKLRGQGASGFFVDRLADAWRALDEGPGSAASRLALDPLDRWVRANAGRLPDALALTAAIDTVRNEPDCLSCRRTLRSLLWTALERPPVAVRRRDAPGQSGQRYLDALR
jgi:hypothetical protein